MDNQARRKEKGDVQVKQDSLAGFFDVYTAQHRKDSIYVGRDPSVNWSVFVNGEWERIDDARTLKEAKQLGHAQFDRGQACCLKLDWSTDWHLVDGTYGGMANTCLVCGNPVTYDDGITLRCPDCGWEHIYSSEERRWFSEH